MHNSMIYRFIYTRCVYHLRSRYHMEDISPVTTENGYYCKSLMLNKSLNDSLASFHFVYTVILQIRKQINAKHCISSTVNRCISSKRSFVYHHCERKYSLRLMIYACGDDIHAARDNMPLLSQWIKKFSFNRTRIFWRRCRDLNPSAGRTDLPDFESGPFNHLGTSPYIRFAGKSPGAYTVYHTAAPFATVFYPK